jgi:acetyl esterase/lipase
MKKQVSFILLLVFVTFFATSQERYLDNISEDIVVETHTYISKDGQNLDMDIYYPAQDFETERPLILYVHGGGFQGGERNSEGNVKFCTRFASLGYVAASISYRLTRKGTESGFGCQCPANEKLNTFYAAVEDLQDATFYLIENRMELGIDPQKIILAGSSAGAETVLNAAYEPPYCYGLDSGPVDYAGVISMAGAIPDTSKIYDESAVPSLLFHGTDDNLVPYATAPHHYCDEDQPGYLILHGSYTIAQKLEQLEVPYWLHTTCGAAHEIANTPKTKYFDVMVEFCYNFVLNNTAESRHTVIEGKKQNPDYETFNFCNE